MIDPGLNGIKPHFRPEQKRSNPYRILLWLSLIVGGVWLHTKLQAQEIEPLFMPTPTPTRTSNSYIVEGETQFNAGNLDAAIAAYREAAQVDSENAQVWAELARIQTYSSRLLSTDTEKFERMKEALNSIDRAVALGPDDAEVLAIRSLVLDWYATVAGPFVSPEEVQAALNEAEKEATRAYNLDPTNALALAYYSEILIDQQKWSQAEQYIEQAAELEPDSMDVHRVYGYVWESLGQYRLAIEEYQKAADITPNLTFLYISIGQNFRSLEVHNRALEYFEKAAKINEQKGIEDPFPYIEIAKTYSRDGEFFIAALNAEKALSFNPSNANTYGQLASIYMRARNFESAMPAFKCAVQGCSAEENQISQEVLDTGVAVEGLPLTSGTVGFYYVQYGSVLAALSRPGQNYCREAMEVLAEVRKQYPDDPIFNSIIEENENICNRAELQARP
ncbi:MAG TPA: tetratricopeptide repeat protein [Anaerolineales bacterium]|jgi:tetratricopeptide (TPR) repeat protein